MLVNFFLSRHKKQSVVVNKIHYTSLKCKVKVAGNVHNSNMCNFKCNRLIQSYDHRWNLKPLVASAKTLRGTPLAMYNMVSFNKMKGPFDPLNNQVLGLMAVFASLFSYIPGNDEVRIHHGIIGIIPDHRLLIHIKKILANCPLTLD